MKRFVKGFISIILILVICITITVITPLNAYADSNSRISTYINLAANGEITDGDTSGMTEDQLRFLGVYLSNFYIPFGTELGTSGGDITETTTGDMIETLQQKFAFSEELATSIVETIFGYTRSSLKDLKICISPKSNTYTELKSFECNYYNFFMIMCGRLDYLLSVNNFEAPNMTGINNKGNPDNSGKYGSQDCYNAGSNLKISGFNGEMFPKEKVDNFIKNTFSDYKSLSDVPESSRSYMITLFKLICGAYDNIYFCYENEEGKLVPVFDAYTKQRNDKEGNMYPTLRDTSIVGSSHYTASQLAFFKSLESTCNLDKGYGTNFWDFVYGEVSFKDLNDGAKQGVYTSDEALEMSMLKAQMKVDCFGDVVRFGANHKVVAVPACINPYVWQAVDPDGKDKGNPGALFNIANSICMSQAEIKDGISSGQNMLISSASSNKFSLNFEALNASFKNMESNGVVWDDSAFIHTRLFVGSTETNVDSNIPDFYRLFKKSASGFSHSGTMLQGWWDSVSAVEMPAPRSNSTNSNHYVGVMHTDKVAILKNVVFIDNLGVFKDEGGNSQDFKAFNVDSFLNSNGNVVDDGKSISFGKSSFGSLFEDISSGKMDVPYDASEQALSTLYVTYCWAGLYDSDSKKDTIGRLGYRLNSDILPDMSNVPITFSGFSTDVELQSIKDWVYYLLHPTQGFEYVRLLITNKVNHLLLGWHNDMVGTNGVGITTGTTKYRSNMGYVTMPDLSEIKWTDSLINMYNTCIPFFIIALIVIMLFAFITGVIDFQHAILGVLLFSVFSLLPVNLINAAVEQSNRISQNIYGKKFTYWALVQQESYAKAIDEAANSEGSSGTSSYGNYLRTLYEENQTVYTNQGSESILIKWQAPKKMASLVLTESDSKSLDGLSNVGKNMLSGMLGRTYGGQSYVDDEDSVYMYRSYLDISNFSRYIYKGIKDGTVKSRKDLSGVDTSNWKSFENSKGKMIKSLSTLKSEYQQYIKDGYSNGTSFGNKNKFSDQFYLSVPISSNIIGDTLKQYDKISSFNDSKDMVSLNSDIFNFGIPMFTNSSVKMNYDTFAATGLITDADRKKDLKNYMKKYKEEDFVGLAAYALYSENPYYYFSWKLYADGLDANSSLSGATGYRNLLLGKSEGGYFYNTSGNGGLKDFMNMKGLFTYIIPYMKQCNDMVREWDDTFGIFVYEGIPTEEGHWSEVSGNPELEAKYWHNLNVTRLYGIYCPWVDVMYDCSYAKAENITVMGKKVTVSDPLNPNSYPSDRPMIFSETEMTDYGLTEADLTQVEKLILKCNEQYQERMYDLLNYYNFSDVTLDSAAAINCAFVFNNTFSENGIFTENHNIYPQSFDLANFSYDAFLRFMLSNATGESMLDDSSTSGGTSTGQTSGDFYERIANNSSIVTVVVMLINDVISVYLVPAFRIFFLIAIFLSFIFMVLVSDFKVEDNIKFVRKVMTRFLLPILLFFIATIGFSWIISLFMGVGNNEVTGSENISISMGDPVITMLLMVVINILLLIVYWKILKGSLKDIKHHAKLLRGVGHAVLAGSLGFVTGAISSGLAGLQSAGSKIANGYRRRRAYRMDKSRNRSLNDIAENTSQPAQRGTGVENSRASERGTNVAIDTSEDYRGIPRKRDVDKDRRSFDTIKESRDEINAKQEAINRKAQSGSEKLRRQQHIDRVDRFFRDEHTIYKDFGYALKNGRIDKSKLSAKDRYKYESRMNRINSREEGIKQRERIELAEARKKEANQKNNRSDS